MGCTGDLGVLGLELGGSNVLIIVISIAIRETFTGFSLLDSMVLV